MEILVSATKILRLLASGVINRCTRQTDGQIGLRAIPFIRSIGEIPVSTEIGPWAPESFYLATVSSPLSARARARESHYGYEPHVPYGCSTSLDISIIRHARTCTSAYNVRKEKTKKITVCYHPEVSIELAVLRTVFAQLSSNVVHPNFR